MTRSKVEARKARTGETADPAAAVAPAFDIEDAGRTVDTFIRLLEGVYAHMPLKRAMYGIDPVQQLRRLGQRLPSLDDAAFRRELGEIVRSLRDAHTLYIGPSSLAGKVARLPFLIEQYGQDDRPRFVVSKVAEGFVDDPQFTAGVELVSWNGAPIAAAVRERARLEIAGRPDSGQARAVESLTFRALRFEPAPIEQWVTVGYWAGDGTEREVRIPWAVIDPLSGPTSVTPATGAAAAVAVNPTAAVVRRAKKLMFNSALWRSEPDLASVPIRLNARGDVTGRFADSVSGHIRTTSSGDIGYLRLWSFDVDDDDAFVDEVAAIVAQLPTEGLVVDLRANPGGLIWAAERLLQLFTPNRIEPVRFSLLATDMTVAMAKARQNENILGRWSSSLQAALATGELYSQALAITAEERCNDIGQTYGGPVIAVVDSTTYSAGDLFAAGFVDNQVGTLITVGEATGAGGANVWNAETLAALTVGTPVHVPVLSGGVGFTVSIRRATRVGASAGLPIEDVGVAGHRRYTLTRNDLLNGNADLLDMCGRLLAGTPKTTLSVAVAGGSIVIASKGLTSVDVYADGRPVAGTVPVSDDAPLTLPLPRFGEQLEVVGYNGAVVRQRRVVRSR